MTDDSTAIELSRSELREVAGYAVACARPALAIFGRERPDDRRPRAAIDAALTAAASTPLASTALAAPDLQPLRQDRRLVERSSSPSPSGSSGIWAAWRRRPDPFGRGLASQPTLSPAGATTNQVDQDHPRLVLAAVTVATPVGPPVEAGPPAP
jgi:hypothetical protein